MAGQGGVITCVGQVTIEGKAFVKTEIDGDDLGQLSPAAATMMGIQFIQAAIEAERDAGMLAFLMSDEGPGFEPEAAAVFLQEMRKRRDQFDPAELVDVVRKRVGNYGSGGAPE